MKTKAGFTLLELLVVIAIIAILASFIAVAMTWAISTARRDSTEVMLRTVSAGVDQYKLAWGDVPPTSLEELGGRSPNGLNSGIETLVACLSRKKQMLYVPPSDDHYSNVDGDRAGRNVTGWYFGNNELRELRDSFGHTIAYVHHRDYARPSKRLMTYVFVPSGPPTRVDVARSAATQAFLGPGGYQLRSVGEDGLPGTEDDVVVGP